jgi:hypothetical protein
VTAAAGNLVPLHPEPVPVAGENASWDAFWAEKTGAGTTTIRGVEVRVPTDITLAAQREMEQRAAGTGVDSWAPVVGLLFRNPDGSPCTGLWDAWRAAGMGMSELGVVIMWGMSHARGVPISFAEAYQLKTGQGDEGKAEEPTEEPTRKTSRAATGGRSKRPSARHTASTPTGSRT